MKRVGTRFARDFRDLHGEDPGAVSVTAGYGSASLGTAARDPMPGAGLAWRISVAVAILCVTALVAVMAVGLIGIGALAIAVAIHG